MMLAESYSSHLVPHCPEHNRNLCLKTEPVTVLLYCTVCLASGPDKRFSQNDKLKVKNKKIKILSKLTQEKAGKSLWQMTEKN